MGADEKSTAEQWVGRTIAGKYRVEDLLGKGGMGLVVRARHVRLDEDVAIKILLPAMLEVPGMVTRFVREARAA
jgi:eukaryotic-like serine/threonine-protein kinase